MNMRLAGHRSGPGLSTNLKTAVTDAIIFTVTVYCNKVN